MVIRPGDMVDRIPRIKTTKDMHEKAPPQKRKAGVAIQNGVVMQGRVIRK